MFAAYEKEGADPCWNTTRWRPLPNLPKEGTP